jgi:hypothetical protein
MGERSVLICKCLHNHIALFVLVFFVFFTLGPALSIRVGEPESGPASVNSTDFHAVTVEVPDKLNAGLIFVERHKAYLGVSEWVLMMTVQRITDYEPLLANISQQLSVAKAASANFPAFASEVLILETELSKIRADIADFVTSARRVRRDAPDDAAYIRCSPDANSEINVCRTALMPVWVPESSTVVNLQTVRFLRQFYNALELRLAADLYGHVDRYNPRELFPWRPRKFNVSDPETLPCFGGAFWEAIGGSSVSEPMF